MYQRASFDRLQGAVAEKFGLGDLIEQDLDSVEPAICCKVDALRHIFELFVFESPKRVGGESDRIRGSSTVGGGGDCCTRLDR